MFRILIAVVVCLPAGVAQSIPSASIRGTVTDDKGRTMSGVLVTALLNARPPFSRTSTSAGDGSFQILGVPAGQYSLCAQVAGGGYVDPCQWSLTLPTVTVAANQASTGNAVRMAKGSVVKIRLQDPGGQMGQKTRDGRKPHLLIGVATPRGAFSPAHQTGKSGNSADFEVTVPVDTRLTMQVVSRDLRLGDDHGSPLSNNGAREPFLQGNADPNPKSFSYTVLGLVP